jgi:hypothetical protein
VVSNAYERTHTTLDSAPDCPADVFPAGFTPEWSMSRLSGAERILWGLEWNHGRLAFLDPSFRHRVVHG